MYILTLDSKYDYEIKNIILGVYTDLEKAEQDKYDCELRLDSEFKVYLTKWDVNEFDECEFRYYTNI